MQRVDRLMNDTRVWISDAGLETCMIFDEGLDLPHFASFVLLDTEAGRAAMNRYFARYLALAVQGGTGFQLGTVTWRANMGWAPRMGLDEAAIREINLRAADYVHDLRKAHETATLPIVIDGAIGPSGDGYRIDATLTADEAEALHRVQIEALAEGGVDMVTAYTMTHPGEAIGIARAARRAGLPHALSFTLETDGRLPNGQTLHEGLAEVEAATGGSALFYMVNCVHPAHFVRDLDGPMRARIGGIRANASRLSHAELDLATELDDGDPEEFGHFYATFGRFLPNLRLVGGCCGSDHRHVGAACRHLHGTGRDDHAA